MSYLLRALLIGVAACLIGCTTVPSIDYAGNEVGGRIAHVSAESEDEILFHFHDNVALFWRVALAESYFRRNGIEKIDIKVRPEYTDEESVRGMDLYFRRADGKRFLSGRYTFHIVLDAAYPDYPEYKKRSIQTGYFLLRTTVKPRRRSENGGEQNAGAEPPGLL